MKEMLNNLQQPREKSFAFSAENQAKAAAHIAKYPVGRQASAVLPLLDLAQRQSGGWLPPAAIETVAAALGMPEIRVYEVASFYTMFNLKPVGKYHVQLCGTTPCWLRGAAELKERCQSVLGIKEGDVTKDGNFSLVEVECLGACVNAPMVQINDDFYEDLTPDQLEKVLGDLANNRACIVGSQIGRQASAPEGYSAPGAGMKAEAAPKPKTPAKGKKAKGETDAG